MIKRRYEFGSLGKELIVHPDRLFWLFAATHLLLWTLIPALVCPNAPLDVIENYAWGREWLMGTHKHPPMQGWWLEIVYILTGRAMWAHFLASQIAIVIAFWAVWRTGYDMLGKKAALVGVLLLEGIVYYNFTSPEFNANILQLPFWALAGWSFHRAVKDNRLIDWVLLGIWSAGSLYSKYSSGLLLATLLVLLFAHPDARKRLKGFGPYVALALTVVLLLPHIQWLIQNNFQPFLYTTTRLYLHHNSFLLTGLVTGQLAVMAPGALLFFACFNRKPHHERRDMLHSFDRTFLCFITFGPFLLALLFSLVFGFRIHDMWATPFWNFIGLWAIFRFHPTFSRESLQRFTGGWLIIFVSILIAFAANARVGPYLMHKTQRTDFPGRELAEQVSGEWHKRYNTPLKYVIGDTWPAGNVAFYTPERPHVLIMGDYTISPWIDRNDLATEGGVIVWCLRYCGAHGFDEKPPDFIHDEFPDAEIQQPLTFSHLTRADIEPVILGWAIVPPEDDPQNNY